MKIINGVKWMETAKDKPQKDCKIVLLNRTTSMGNDYRDIRILDYSCKHQALNCRHNYNNRIELSEFHYWCYADEFFKQFEDSGIDISGSMF